MQENTWARLRDSLPDTRDSRNLSRVFSCISVQNSVYAAPDHKGVGRRFDGKKRGEGGTGNFEPTSDFPERSWQLAFQFQPTDSATCDEFTVQSAFQKLVALVRGARVDDAAIKAKTGGKSALLAHVLLTPTRSFIAIIIFKHAVREERG